MHPSILNYKSSDPYLELPNSHAHRKYELVHFPSGLRCLLISDSASHMVAASMTVGCGSFNDPDEIHGLAHLCEHLIVLSGPQARLREVVSGSGRNMNAYTGSDQTSFAFEISSYVNDGTSEKTFILDALLSVFAAYFTKIKVSTASIHSEIRSVHQEQLLNTSNMDKILWHGLRLLAKKTHPFSRFATGNASTLTKPPIKVLKAELEAYHSLNFQPQNMALVIKGPQSINHLKKVVINSFLCDQVVSDSNYAEPSKSFLKYGSAFDKSNANILYIKGNTSRVRFCFPLAHATDVLPENIHTMLCNIIGNESAGSLCYHLKKTTQVAENVLVHTLEISKDNHMLFIDVEATNQGMKRLVLVVNMVLQFLETTMMQIPDNELALIIHEYLVVEKIQFRNRKIPASALEEIVAYSEYFQAHTSKSELIVKGGEALEHVGISSKVVKGLFRRFLCRNTLILQIVDFSPTPMYQFDDCTLPRLTQKDEYFGFEYFALKRHDFSRFPLVEVPHFEVSLPLGDLTPKILLLLESKPRKMTTKYRDLKMEELSPKIWYSTDILQIWTHILSHSEEEAELSARIKFQEVCASAENLVGIEIMASIMGERLQHIMYNLETLGCAWGVYVNVNGEPSIMLSFSGPSELIGQGLTMMICGFLASFGQIKTCHYQEIKRARVLLRRTYEDYVNSPGVKFVFVTASILFDEGLVKPEKRIKALEIIDPEALEKLGAHILGSNTFTSVLVSGNISEIQLTEVKNQCTVVPSEAPKNIVLHPESSYLLPRGECLTLDIQGMPGDPLAVVFYYMQVGERRDLYGYAMAKLVELVVSAYVVSDLRIKRGLAYGVFAGMRMFKKTCGVHITVPSGEHSCEYIVEQIEEFLENLVKNIAYLTETQFRKLTRELIDSAEEPPKDEAVTSNLFFSLQPVNGSSDQKDEEQHTVHWNNMEQILNHTYNFGGKLCEERLDIDVLEHVTLNQFQQFFNRTVSPKSQHKSVAVICKNAEEMTRDDKIHFVCKFLMDKLQENNLYLSEETLLEKLQSCLELETLMDLDLKQHFKGLSQNMKYHKFRVMLKVGGMMKKFGTNSCKDSRDTTTAKTHTFNSMQDIQLRCSLVG